MGRRRTAGAGDRPDRAAGYHRAAGGGTDGVGGGAAAGRHAPGRAGWRAASSPASGRSGPAWCRWLLVILGLVGFALRERSAGYAFSAGLVLELAVTLGYTLATLTAEDSRSTSFFYVTLLQLATDHGGRVGRRLAAGAAMAGRVARTSRAGLPQHRADERATRHGRRGQPGAAGLGAGAAGLSPAGRWQDWSIAAGLPLGWIALALPLVAWRLRGRLRPQLVGLAGMAALGLLACTVRGLGAYWHFRERRCRSGAIAP